MVESAITGLDDNIRDFLLGNGRADLHCAACLCVDLTAHLARGKCRTMYAIAPGAPTKHNDMIPRLYLARMAPMREYTQAPAEDERVVHVSRMIEDGTIDGGNAHLIAVVPYTIHYTAGNSSW